MPGSIKDRVAIAGMGCTKFGERWDASLNDLLVDAAYRAFEDAGIGPEDIQAAWLGTTQGQMGMTLSQPLRLPSIPITRVENACCTAGEAFRGACYAVAAGIHDIVLAIGVEKLAEGAVGSARPGPQVYQQAPAPANFALLATSYFSLAKTSQWTECLETSQTTVNL